MSEETESGKITSEKTTENEVLEPEASESGSSEKNESIEAGAPVKKKGRRRKKKAVKKEVAEEVVEKGEVEKEVVEEKATEGESPEEEPEFPPPSVETAEAETTEKEGGKIEKPTNEGSWEDHPDDGGPLTGTKDAVAIAWAKEQNSPLKVGDRIMASRPNHLFDQWVKAGTIYEVVPKDISGSRKLGPENKPDVQLTKVRGSGPPHFRLSGRLDAFEKL